SFRPLSFIGKYSGYIYAFHWPVIISLGCGMFLLLTGRIPGWLLLSLIFIFVIAIPIGLGYSCKVFYKQVDKLERRLFTKKEAS
ncbi:MAG: hypothetical protein IKE48_03310, partial [Parasporobacterium sp.]|nr:hypothetical protein [Parasporobacterium sp.]